MIVSSQAHIIGSLIASDPQRMSGVHVRAKADALLFAWLESIQKVLPVGTPWIKVSPRVDANSLLGGLDLAATLAASRPVLHPGLMARAHTGFLILSNAERCDPSILALIQQTMDEGCVRIEREGFQQTIPAQFSLIVLDEGSDQDSSLPLGLLDRLPFYLDTHALLSWQEHSYPLPIVYPHHVSKVSFTDEVVKALCGSALQLGITSMRPPQQALSVAQCLAAIEGRSQLKPEDLIAAGALVYTARAKQLPPVPEESQQQDLQEPQDHSDSMETPPQDLAQPQDSKSDESDLPPPPSKLPESGLQEQQILSQIVLGLPPDLLERLAAGFSLKGSGKATSSGWQRKVIPRHGRPVGSRKGDPRRGMPLDLGATLRAAIPWQKIRAKPLSTCVSVRSSDLHVKRLKPRTRSTAVFAVDASGSAALQRLSEAKGAVEALLAQCYVRRDQVALVSFRGASAEILLPPTRSFTRVRRELSALPGGGGTPLARGLQLAAQVADECRRKGDAPLMVLLTDGKGNVALDGTGGRAKAEKDLQAVSQAIYLQGLPCMVVDISPLPQERARHLAQSLGGEYLALPMAKAETLSRAVNARMVSAP
jgi:magnesium chelatase subunit D